VVGGGEEEEEHTHLFRDAGSIYGYMCLF